MIKYGKHLTIVALLSVAAVATATVPVAAEETGAEYTSEGAVKFVPNTDPVKPVDPVDPGKPVDPIDPLNPGGPNPGTPGPLSIDFASSFDFGTNKISSVDEVYYANPQLYKEEGKETANYVQVTDNRGVSTGWDLKVKQEAQFKNATAKYKTLNGSVVTLNNGQADSNSEGVTAPTTVKSVVLNPDEAVPVMSAADSAGDGTWVDVFGGLKKVEIVNEEGVKETVNKNTDVQLEVPGKTPKSAVEYRAKLTWILSEVAGN
ncbi:WxL domain-containing protein [Brochothrix thermosphacta]|uniref:WxL domain-containing protein n=1 Tax=Brochothrix thermosphacta TaxID=2756 RepID=UPI003F9AEDBF